MGPVDMLEANVLSRLIRILNRVNGDFLQCLQVIWADVGHRNTSTLASAGLSKDTYRRKSSIALQHTPARPDALGYDRFDVYVTV